MLFCRRTLSLALLTVCVGPAFAQTAGTGNITGTVTDSTGAAIPGATVLITDTDTGAKRTVATNGDAVAWRAAGNSVQIVTLQDNGWLRPLRGAVYPRFSVIGVG